MKKALKTIISGCIAASLILSTILPAAAEITDYSSIDATYSA